MKVSYTELLIKDCEWLSAEEKEIVLFGLMQGKSLLCSIIITLFIGLLMGMFRESVLFILCFLPLRRYAGGFHAKTRIGCLIFSITVIIVSFLMIKCIRCGYWVIEGIFLICLIVLWKIAPIGNEKKLLSEEEKTYFAKKTKVIVVIETLVMLIALLIGKDRYVVVMMSVFVAEVFYAILGYIKLKELREK